MVLEDAAQHYYIHTKENAARLRKFQRLITFGYVTSLLGIPRILNRRVGRNKLDEKNQAALDYLGFHQKASKLPTKSTGMQKNQQDK